MPTMKSTIQILSLSKHGFTKFRYGTYAKNSYLSATRRIDKFFKYFILYVFI